MDRCFWYHKSYFFEPHVPVASLWYDALVSNVCPLFYKARHLSSLSPPTSTSPSLRNNFFLRDAIVPRPSSSYLPPSPSINMSNPRRTHIPQIPSTPNLRLKSTPPTNIPSHTLHLRPSLPQPRRTQSRHLARRRSPQIRPRTRPASRNASPSGRLRRLATCTGQTHRADLRPLRRATSRPRALMDTRPVRPRRQRGALILPGRQRR